MKKPKGPKVLLIDIETAPILAHVWGLFDQNVGLNMVKSDWHLLSFSAKWLGEKEVMYSDQRNEKNIENDSKLLKQVWKLLDAADVVVGQNSNKFDLKKLNARFIMNGMQPPSSYKKMDTLLIARKHFAFTSNKLEFMTDKLCTKYKKLKHSKFSGFELWKQCLAGNIEAWDEMRKYNMYDVLSLEELFMKLVPWENGLNFNLYHDGDEEVCKCGSSDFIKKGFHYTASSKFQRWRCKDCGSESRDRENLLGKKVRISTR